MMCLWFNYTIYADLGKYLCSNKLKGNYDMKLIDAIVGFFKRLFAGKADGECEDCGEKGVCQTTDKNKKYALIVGMETSKWGSCPGSDKDSNTMLGLIKQYVDESHIVKLNSKQATVSAVTKALKEQIAKVPEDGLMIFTYSGHGGQYNKSSTAKDETDGQDEFLCLYDGALIDNDLWTIFGNCKGRAFVVYDCCHSGTMYRLPSEQEEGDGVEDRLPLEQPFFAKFENVRDVARRMLVVSGCGEETISWGDSVQGGVLTASMKRAFNKCLNYREWWKKFKEDSAFKKVKQVPICTKIGAFDLEAKIFN